MAGPVSFGCCPLQIGLRAPAQRSCRCVQYNLCRPSCGSSKHPVIIDVRRDHGGACSKSSPVKINASAGRAVESGCKASNTPRIIPNIASVPALYFAGVVYAFET
jgi:hypothetical protein